MVASDGKGGVVEGVGLDEGSIQVKEKRRPDRHEHLQRYEEQRPSWCTLRAGRTVRPAIIIAQAVINVKTTPRSFLCLPPAAAMAQKDPRPMKLLVEITGASGRAVGKVSGR